MAKRFVPLFGLFLALGMGVLPLRAQTIDSTPLAPPPDLPPPVVMPIETPKGALEAPAAPAPSEPAAPASATAVFKSVAPPASEVILPDRLTLESRPALISHGKGEWEKAYDQLREAVTKLKATAEKSKLSVVGYPLTIFIETDNSGFTYDIMLPIAAASPPPPDLASDVKLGETPTGKAIRFVHLASYDEIDGAYEQITAYLDAKDIVVKDAFIEEYLAFGDKSNSPETMINILVQPKK
ncbi:MAG: GyrI-like domain-containing protein [Hyphomicrobiales bacterium]